MAAKSSVSAFRAWMMLIPAFVLPASVCGEAIGISRPAGFIWFSVGPQEQVLASSPFTPLTAQPPLWVLLPTNAAREIAHPDVLATWDAAAQVYELGYGPSQAVPACSDWTDAQGAVIQPAIPVGRGFWFWNKQAYAEGLFFSGEIVLDAEAAMPLYPELNLLAYPFSSTSDHTTNSVLNEAGVLLAEDGSVQEAADMAVGQGYWFRSAAAEIVTWVEDRPYANVFPVTNATLHVASLRPDPGDGAVVLRISATDPAVASVDILYQDLSATEAFDPLAWSLAAAGLSVSPEGQVEWRDTGSPSRPPPSHVFGRCYVVARGDVDNNHDGIPDARAALLSGLDAASHGGVQPGAEPSLVAGEELATLVSPGGSNVVTTTELAVPLLRVVFVDRLRGDDAFTGRKRIVQGAQGPKKTVAAGLRTARDGNILVIRGGRYAESLDIHGRDVRVVLDGNVDLTAHRVATRIEQAPVDLQPTNRIAGGNP